MTQTAANSASGDYNLIKGAPPKRKDTGRGRKYEGGKGKSVVSSFYYIVLLASLLTAIVVSRLVLMGWQRGGGG